VAVAWLVRGDRVLASLEVPSNRRARAKGLIGREGLEGGMVLSPCRSVHTFGMRFAIDVAFLDADNVVLCTLTLRPQRLSMPRRRARCVIEARAGAFERWGLEVGQELEVRM